MSIESRWSLRHVDTAADTLQARGFVVQELERNAFGTEWSFRFSPECNDPIISTLPGVFPSIPGSMSFVEVRPIVAMGLLCCL